MFYYANFAFVAGTPNSATFLVKYRRLSNSQII